MRQCISCGGSYPDDLFATYTKRDGTKGILNTCKACKVENHAKYRPKAEKVDTAQKTCNVCHTPKPLMEFPQHKVKGNLYHRPTCKSCINEKQRQKRNEGKPVTENPKKEPPKARGLDIIAHAIALQSRLYRYALYIHKDPQNAADAVQNVFMSLLKNKDRYTFVCERTLKNFLYRSIKNECLDQLRQNKPISVDFTEVSITSARETMALELLQIQTILQNFSHVEYKFLKYLYDGYTVESIAQVENIHPSLVKNTILLCHTKIRQICQTP